MLSVIIITKNEESSIAECLDSVAWADEKIIIDDYSTDRTIETAQSKGAIVYKHALDADFSRQRNIGLQKASHEWVLFLDADEKVSHSLQYEITTAINDSLNTIQGYYVKRIDTMWDKKIRHGEAGNMVLLRLARKHAGKWKGKVHEVWEINGRKETLTHSLDHFPHQTMKQFLQEINFYSTIRAEELYKKRKHTSNFQIIAYPMGKFVLNYFFKLGFLDGMPGLLIAFMMSFHSFLVRGKLWSIQSQKGNAVS